MRSHQDALHLRSAQRFTARFVVLVLVGLLPLHPIDAQSGSGALPTTTPTSAGQDTSDDASDDSAALLMTGPLFRATTMELVDDGRLLVADALARTLVLLDSRTGELLAELAVDGVPTRFDYRPAIQQAALLVRGDAPDQADRLLLIRLDTGDADPLQLTRTITLASRASDVLLTPQLALVGVTSRDQQASIVPVRLDTGSLLTAQPVEQLAGLSYREPLLFNGLQAYHIDLESRQTSFTQSVLLSVDAPLVSLSQTGRLLTTTFDDALLVTVTLLAGDDSTDALRVRPIVVLLLQLAMNASQRTGLDLTVSGPDVSLLADMAVDPRRREWALAYAGSASLHLVDPLTGLTRLFVDTLPFPAALQYSSDGVRLYVHHPLASQVTVYQADFYTVTAQLATSRQSVDASRQVGMQLYHRVEQDSERAVGCITCHASPLWPTPPQPIVISAGFADAAALDAHYRAVLMANGMTSPGLSTAELASLLDYITTDVAP